MKSLSARITLWYASAASAVLCCFFVAGHYMLQGHLVQQLDALNESQFKHLASILGPGYEGLSPADIEERIREATESASTLFFIDMHGPMTNRFFKSHNLQGHSLPDIPGEKAYTAEVGGIGELRIREFHLEPFEVMVATPMHTVYDVMRGFREVFVALTAVTIMASIAIGYVLSQWVLQPIRVIQETANRIRSDHLNERIPVGSVKDEIGQFADFLNKMFDRLETSFNEIRRFAADASHELKTPLSIVRLHGERLLGDEQLTPEQRESIHVQLEELARVNRIIEELLFLSRADAQVIAVDLQSQDPSAFIDSFSQDAAALAEHHGLRYTSHHLGDAPVCFEAKRMRQVLLNLLDNAIRVSPPGARITLSSEVSGGLWRIRIDDEGPGLNEEQREKAFERFVRFPGSSRGYQGSGLGLAICRSIIHLHQGCIFALAGPGGVGLRLVIEVPQSKQDGIQSGVAGSNNPVLAHAS